MISGTEPRARVLTVESAEMVDLAREALAAGGSVWLHARGNSMHPVIPDGTPVRVRPLPGRELRAGDVVFALGRGRRPMLHRVRRVANDQVILAGDAHLIDDPPIPSTDVLGIADRILLDGRERRLSSRRLARAAGLVMRVLRRTSRWLRARIA